MAISKIKTGFTKYTDGKLLTKGNYIATKMTGNVNFATPSPTVKDVQDATGSFGDSIVGAKNGTKADTANKNAMRAALIFVLNSLGIYIQSQSGGDETINLSSGYDVAKTPARIGLLAKPQNFEVNAGPNSGSVALSATAVPQADFYEFEYQVLDTDAVVPAVWITQTSTKKTCIISGLTVGGQYNFRVAGAGTDTMRVYSDVIAKYIS